MRNHLKHEFEQEQRQKAHSLRLLPMEILANRVFPHAFDSLPEALNILLTCKDALNLGKTEAFWRFFLNKVMVARLAWMRSHGYADLADVVQSVYQVFPPNMTVKDCVLSKFFFEEFPPGFPFAREVPLELQSSWAMSKTRYRASCFKNLKPWAPEFNRVGEYVEISPMWVNRGVFLQRFCSYSVTGLNCGTYHGREYLFITPAKVQLRGWKSSFTPSWYRLGVWRLERTGVKDSFLFEGKFSVAVDRPKGLESVGVGKLWIDGIEVGKFRMFNLFGLPDCQAHTFGLEGLANPDECYVINLRLGKLEKKSRSYRLLDEAFKTQKRVAREDAARIRKDQEEEDTPQPEGEAEAKRSKKSGRGRKKGLKIAEYDYSDLSRATYVCRWPEGTFSADELAVMFGDDGVEKVTKFDQRNRIPAQIANFMAHRVTDKGLNEFQVRWQGYGELFDTWEPERNLGDRLAEACELFQLPHDDSDEEYY